MTNEEAKKYMKFQIFNYSDSYDSNRLYDFTKEVQSFLGRHKIVDVQKDSKQSVCNGFFASGVTTLISYVITYEE